TYYSLLRSSDSVKIETLVESHLAMASSLHIKGDVLEPDISALIYSALRLPACMPDIDEILIAQTEKPFNQGGYSIENWQRVFAPGRRRRMHFDGDKTLATFIASRSDIDDLVPILIAYQIEWNKLHFLLRHTALQTLLKENEDEAGTLRGADAEKLAEGLKISLDDLRRLEIVWEGHFIKTLLHISEARKDMQMALLSGSLSDYRRATAMWWDELYNHVLDAGVDPEQRPVYFVSSNTHSMINLLTGFAQHHHDNLVNYISASEHESLLAEYETIQSSADKRIENFLYYILGKYLQDEEQQTREKLLNEERNIGIYRVPNRHGFQIEAQIIEPGKLKPSRFDPRLNEGLDVSSLVDSDAVIININYPLGMAAYEILSRITERVSQFRGIYVMGKAATLNGRIGDVMIPGVVHDEHSQNTYMFDNCFSAADVAPYMSVANVLDNQKAVTALGTFLQNPGYMSVFYHEGYTDIEMEGGPYLSAIYEAFRPKRHPENEIVNLYTVPFDIGFLHYASDTPMKKGHNLGAGSLNYTGVEPTYAAAIAILRHIFRQEVQRLATLNQTEKA
ncbi:MAG: DUF6909 family protein, partial [Aggregatilineales bacterium]